MTQATKKDIGKWCKFYDEDSEKSFHIDKLYTILDDGEYFETRYTSDIYNNCTPLTQEQIQCLILEEQMKYIKEGQVWKNEKIIYTITNTDGYDFWAITNKGYCCKFTGNSEYIEFIRLFKLIAEYSNWIEAVNSKEFKGELK